MELPTSHAWQPDQPLSRHQMDLAFRPLHSRGLVAEKAHNTVCLLFKIPALNMGRKSLGCPSRSADGRCDRSVATNSPRTIQAAPFARTGGSGLAGGF
jgi:hypothetical protein